MADKLTRQGLRNLDIKPRNGKRPSEENCVHRWEHDPDCPCDSKAFLHGPDECMNICRRCGAVQGGRR